MGVISTDTSKAFDSLLPAVMIRNQKLIIFYMSGYNCYVRISRVGKAGSNSPLLQVYGKTKGRDVPKVRALDPCCGTYFKMIYTTA